MLLVAVQIWGAWWCQYEWCSSKSSYILSFMSSTWSQQYAPEISNWKCKIQHMLVGKWPCKSGWHVCVHKLIQKWCNCSRKERLTKIWMPPTCWQQSWHKHVHNAKLEETSSGKHEHTCEWIPCRKPSLFVSPPPNWEDFLWCQGQTLFFVSGSLPPEMYIFIHSKVYTHVLFVSCLAQSLNIQQDVPTMKIFQGTELTCSSRCDWMPNCWYEYFSTFPKRQLVTNESSSFLLRGPQRIFSIVAERKMFK